LFTLNNYIETDIKRLAHPYEQVKYKAFGEDVATPHFSQTWPAAHFDDETCLQRNMLHKKIWPAAHFFSRIFFLIILGCI